MTDNIIMILATALLNGAVTYGVIKTQIAWLRRDVDKAHDRITNLEDKLERRSLARGQEWRGS